MKSNPNIVWLRQDFRILRNEALSFAKTIMQMCQQFTFLKKKLTIKEQAQKWWIYSILKNFKFDLEKYNVNLEIASYNTYQDFLKNILKKFLVILPDL